MNVALIHDRLHIKTFWEKRIDAHSQNTLGEEERMNGSALQKLVAAPHHHQHSAVPQPVSSSVS